MTLQNSLSGLDMQYTINILDHKGIKTLAIIDPYTIINNTISLLTEGYRTNSTRSVAHHDVIDVWFTEKIKHFISWWN